MATEATSFPMAIGLAGSFDRQLMHDIQSVTAREVRARGVHLALSPVVDIARDPRWGRIEETFGEDPYLCGEMGVAAVLGLAAVMQANPLLFQGLQWFGAAYLCWMGFQLLRTRFAANDAAVEPQRSGWTYFRQACAVSLTNPKVILFFVAFFPLFLRADASGGTLVAMMLHVTALSFLYQAGLVLVGNAVAAKLKALPFARRLATQLAGVALVGFGLKLAASNR